MEKISSGKILTHTDRFKKHRPITADVFLTNYCNNNCDYCTYKRNKLACDRYDMPYSEFRKYATRLRRLGVLGIILTGGGEPTLNPEFELMTKFLERNRYHYGINTNFNEIKYCKPDFLKVSLDGWDEDSYERVRGVRNYEKTVENIRMFSEWKEKNSPKTLLGIQMVGKSVTEVDAFYKANKDLDVDYISIRPVESRRGKYYAKNRDANEDPHMIRLYLKRLAEHDKRVTVNFKWDMLNTKSNFCNANWAQIAVDERGNVLYCCHKPDEIVGHLSEKDILKKKANFKTNMKKCDTPCRMTCPNYEYLEYKKKARPASFI